MNFFLKIIIFFPFVFLNLANAEEDCVPAVTSYCRAPADCTEDKMRENRQVLFLDMNFSYCEVEKVRCESKKKCEKFTVIPEIDNSKIQEFRNKMFAEKATNPVYEKIFSIKSCQSSLAKKSPYMRKCLRDVLEGKFVKDSQIQDQMLSILYKSVIREEDTRGQESNPEFAAMLETFKKNEPEVYDQISQNLLTELDFEKRLEEATAEFLPEKNNAFILSGHSMGGEVWGGSGEHELKFKKIGELIHRENIQSLFFAACSTGGEDSLKNEMAICGPVPPGRIYGINGTSPSNSTYSANGLANLLAIDQKIASERDIDKIAKEIQKSLMKDRNPILMMCTNDGYKTFSKLGAKDYDPNSNCGYFSDRLRICLNKLINASGENLKFACQFTPDDIGYEAAKKYLENSWDAVQDALPAINYLGPDQNDYMWSEEMMSDIKSPNANKLFEVIYRLSQEDASCLRAVHQRPITEVSGILNLWYKDHLDNIKENILIRFQQELAPDGLYNKYLEEYNKLECSQYNKLNPIGENSFSSRENTAKFLADLITNAGNDFNCSMYDSFSETESYKNWVRMRNLVFNLTYHHIMRGETTFNNCRPDGIIYYEKLDFTDRPHYQELFQTDSKQEEIDCLQEIPYFY